MDIFSMASKLSQMVDTCKFIYKDRRETVRKEYREKLEKHRIDNNTKNLLASAIDLAEGKEAREQLVILASSVD